MTAFVFNKIGYDPFIDYLKGLCIISVVLTHSIPYEWQQIIGFPFWGAQAVPIFLLIQSFHYFKHDSLPSFHFKKLWHRVILSFVIIEFVILLIEYLQAYIWTGGIGTTVLVHWIKGGGSGPGSFYVWIYIQFAVLLPLIGKINKRFNIPSCAWLILFVVLSELLEILCSIVDLPGYIYRLLVFRYVFLIYGGYLWAKKGVTVNFTTILFALISLACIYFLQYRNLTFKPFICISDWKYFHWFCYFYPMSLLVYILRKIYDNIWGGVKYIQILGKYSYHIYLWQMLVFSINIIAMRTWVYTLVTTILSIIPIQLYAIIKRNELQTNN